ncbi:MAG: hypothetical protein HOD60_14965 [Candidatus Nitrosopelagicus sp.]|jgi:hypothetical protein|nr:hypothetical protein [Candidatus Nitrosopelagicus sp.]
MAGIIDMINLVSLFICFGNRGCDRWWSENIATPDFNILDAILSGSTVIGYIVIIALVVFVVVRVVTVGIAYVKPTNRKGVVAITMWDESTVTGNVNEDTMFHKTEIFRVLAKNPKLTKGMAELREMCELGQLRVYDMKVTDDFKMDLRGGKNIKIIMPGMDIKDPTISWQDTEGDFAIWGTGLKSYPTNILASDLSELITVEDYYGDETDVLVLAPYSRTTKNKLTMEEEKIVISTITDARQLFTNVINLPNKDALAKCVVFLGTLNEIHKELDLKNTEVDNLKDEIYNLQKDYKSLWDTKEGYVSLANTQPIVGFAQKLIPLESKSMIALAGGAVLAGFMSTKLGGIKSLEWLADYDFLFAGAVAVILMAYLKSQEKKVEETVQPRMGVGDPTQ